MTKYDNMSDADIKKLQKEQWPIEKGDNALIKQVCKSMQSMDADDYRKYLVRRDKFAASNAS